MNPILRSLFIPVFAALLTACGSDLSVDEHLTSEDHLGRAQTFLEQANTSSAMVELKHALRKDVDNARASALLGKLYYEAGAYEDSDKELSRALATGADPKVIIPMLAKLLLSLGEFERLDTLSLDGLDPESRSVVQAAKGLSMIYRGKPALAAEIIDTALQNEPYSPYAAVAAARLSMENGEFDEALRQLNDVIASSPEYALAWSLLGDIESAQLRPREAEIAYSKVIKLAGKSFDALLNRALMRIYLGDFQGARLDLVAVGNAFGPARYHPGVLFAWGLVNLQNKQLDLARKGFYETSEYSDNYPQTLYYQSVIALEQGLVSQALSSAYQFLGWVPGSVVGAKLAAKLELGQQVYSKAEKLLLPVVAARPDDIEALNLLASAMLAQSKGKEGLELLAKVTELQPDSIQARARLGASFLAAGSEEKGLQTLRSVLAEYPGYQQADILIVSSYLRQNKVAEAILAAKEYLERNPSSATAYLLLGRAYLASDEAEKAMAAFSIALELRPGDPAAGNSRAEFALSNNDYEAARYYYAQILKHNPDHLQTRMRVAASYAVEGREQEMLESLQSTLSAFPRAMEPRLFKARYYMAKGRLDGVMPLFDALTEEQKDHPQALVTIAGFELAASRYNQALVTLEKLLKVHPDVGQYHYMKAKAYAGLGELKLFSAALERTVSLDPRHFYARIAQARMALLSNHMDAFEKSLAELRELAPDNVDVIKLEVASAQKKGNHEAAKQLLETLFAQEPTTSNLIALAMHDQSVGNASGAIVRLQHWLGTHAADVAAQEKLAEIYASSNQATDVVRQYREILELDPEHVVALNNLAWYLLEDDPEQALAYAERADRLSPDTGAILDTLALAQLYNDNIVEARRAIDRARALAPEIPQMQIHEAQVRAAEGDTKGAIIALLALLEEREKFAGRADAEALLRQLK